MAQGELKLNVQISADNGVTSTPYQLVFVQDAEFWYFLNGCADWIFRAIKDQKIQGETIHGAFLYRAIDPQGNEIVVKPTNAIYKNGKRLGNASASELKVIGTAIYVKGLTDQKWYEWLNNSWQLVNLTTGDTDIFK